MLIGRNISLLKNDRTHGAGWLTAKALKILKDAIEKSQAPSSLQLTQEITQTVDSLRSARPDMVSISNYSLHIQDLLPVCLSKNENVKTTKNYLIKKITALQLHNEHASLTSASKAATLIKQQCIVMTCSYSSTVCQSLEFAKKAGVDFKVLVFESLNNGLSYGDLTANRLRKSGISAVLIPDSNIQWSVARADIILLGTDAISMQGWMINGAPSLEVALMGKKRHKNVYAVGTKAKIDARGILTHIRNAQDGFDIVQLDLISGIILETGMLSPEDLFQLDLNKLMIYRNVRTY